MKVHHKQSQQNYLRPIVHEEAAQETVHEEHLTQHIAEVEKLAPKVTEGISVVQTPRFREVPKEQKKKKKRKKKMKLDIVRRTEESCVS